MTKMACLAWNNMKKLEILFWGVVVLVAVIIINHITAESDAVREKKFDNCMNIVKEENMAHDYQVEFLTSCMNK